MSIHISETTKKEIEGKGYVIRRRGSISVKVRKYAVFIEMN